jgi:hypothetical protein
MPCKKNPDGKTSDISWIRKALEHRPVRKISQEEQDRMFKIFEEAFGEFNRDGSITTVRCDKCTGLIEVRALSPTAWQMSCSCGRFNTTMKGL